MAHETPSTMTLEEIGKLTGWGSHGAYFNSQIAGFPQPETVSPKFLQSLYNVAEVLAWDRERPLTTPQ